MSPIHVLRVSCCSHFICSFVKHTLPTLIRFFPLFLGPRTHDDGVTLSVYTVPSQEWHCRKKTLSASTIHAQGTSNTFSIGFMNYIQILRCLSKLHTICHTLRYVTELAQNNFAHSCICRAGRSWQTKRKK